MFRLWLKTRRWKQERMRLQAINDAHRDQLCIDACTWGKMIVYFQENPNEYREVMMDSAQRLIDSICKYKESQLNLINQPQP